MIDLKSIGDQLMSAYTDILKVHERELLKTINPKELADINIFKQETASIAGNPDLTAGEKNKKILELQTIFLHKHGNNSSK